MTAAPAEVSLVDCNTFLGRSLGSPTTGGSNETAQTLLAEMDRVGVAEAVVYHIIAREYAPAVGNELLVEALAGEPRLHPAWVVLPTFTGEMPPAPELVARFQRDGVRVARMFPSTDSLDHRFAVREWSVGPILTALEEAQLVLELDFGLFRRSQPPWDDIVAVCEHHPDLTVILVDVQGRNNRTLYALLDKFEQLFIQTAGFNVHRGLEDLTARFGAGRLVFGSGYPRASMGAARFDLDRAALSPSDRAAVGGGNLRRMMRARETSEVRGAR